MNVINEMYTRKDTLREIKDHYKVSQRLLVLDDFFEPEVAETLMKAVRKAGRGKDIVPHKHSWTTLTFDKRLKDALPVDSVKNFLKHFTRKTLRYTDTEVKEFGQGDYTLMHDELKQPIFKVYYFISSEDWNENDGGGVCRHHGTKGERHIILPKANRLVVMGLTGNEMSYVRYVRAKAGTKVFRVLELTAF